MCGVCVWYICGVCSVCVVCLYGVCMYGVCECVACVMCVGLACVGGNVWCVWFVGIVGVEGGGCVVCLGEYGVMGCVYVEGDVEGVICVGGVWDVCEGCGGCGVCWGSVVCVCV